MNTTSQSREPSGGQLRKPKAEWPYIAFVVALFALIVVKSCLDQAL